uniref:Uncharacterized protein n=1 Tax=Peronospora matthiolae TaxID=2874970 RepID=A0AAV1VML1_9STRA
MTLMMVITIMTMPTDSPPPTAITQVKKIREVPTRYQAYSTLRGRTSLGSKPSNNCADGSSHL